MDRIVKKLQPGATISTLREQRQVDVIVSAPGLDRAGDEVVQAGIDTRNFIKTGGTVLWGHDADQPIAKAVRIAIVDGKLTSLVQFPPAGVSPKADEIFGLIGAGVVNSSSIGFQPIEWEPIDSRAPYEGRRYTKVELCEFSFVGVPAQPDATIVARDARARTRAPSGSEDEHLQAIAASLASAKRCHAKATAAHSRTRDMLTSMGGLCMEGLRHADALARNGAIPSAADDSGGEDDPNVELALAAERRRRDLDEIEGAGRRWGDIEREDGAGTTAFAREEVLRRLRRAGLLL